MEKEKTRCMESQASRGCQERWLPWHSKDVRWSQDSEYDGAVNSRNNRELLRLRELRRAKKYEHTAQGRFR